MNSTVVSFVESLSPSQRRFNIIRGNQLFETLKTVICREVYYTVSLSWRVHYWRSYFSQAGETQRKIFKNPASVYCIAFSPAKYKPFRKSVWEGVA